MIVVENLCCDCAAPGYPCRGEYCPLIRVPVRYCDVCGCELDGEYFEVNGEELCEDCLKDMFRKEG